MPGAPVELRRRREAERRLAGEAVHIAAVEMNLQRRRVRLTLDRQIAAHFTIGVGEACHLRRNEMRGRRMRRVEHRRIAELLIERGIARADARRIDGYVKL